LSLQSVFRTFIDRGKPAATACFCIALFLFAASTLYGQEAVEQYNYGRKAAFREAVVQYYMPSLFGIVSGEGAGFHQFKRVVKSRFLIPVETKTLLATLFDKVGLSGLGIITPYFEDGALGSFNVSLGVGLHTHNLAKTSFLQGGLFRCILFGKDSHIAVFPDFGLTIGWRFKRKFA
jgi:hypothetical protein